MTGIEDLKEQAARLGREYEEARRRAGELRASLDPTRGTHIAAELGDEKAKAERERAREEAQAAEAEASRLSEEWAGARSAVQAADHRERVEERRRYAEAVRHTEEVENYCHAQLAAQGFQQQSSGEVRDEIEADVMEAVRTRYGDSAVEHCREYLIPRLLPAGPRSGAGMVIR